MKRMFVLVLRTDERIGVTLFLHSVNSRILSDSELSHFHVKEWKTLLLEVYNLHKHVKIKFPSISYKDLKMLVELLKEYESTS